MKQPVVETFKRTFVSTGQSHQLGLNLTKHISNIILCSQCYNIVQCKTKAKSKQKLLFIVTLLQSTKFLGQFVAWLSLGFIMKFFMGNGCFQFGGNILDKILELIIEAQAKLKTVQDKLPSSWQENKYIRRTEEEQKKDKSSSEKICLIDSFSAKFHFEVELITFARSHKLFACNFSLNYQLICIV